MIEKYEIDLNLVLELLKTSIEEVYKEDNNFLISHEPTHKGTNMEEHVGERPIVFRIAYHFQNLLIQNMKDGRLEKDKELRVDVEYNRLYNRSKITHSRPKGSSPDLILHKRNSVDKDVMVCEFKGYWYFEKQLGDEINKDKVKIEEYCDIDGEYRYQMGVMILLEETQYQVEIYDPNTKS